MARMKWTAQRIVLALFLTLITPILYIYAFNALFGTGIAYTVDNWLLAFLVSFLALLLFIAFELVATGAGKVWGALGYVLAIVGILLIPILFIFAFNLLLSVAVPYTIVSY